MRKIIFLLSVVMFMACHKDNNEPTPGYAWETLTASEQLMLGRWSFDSIVKLNNNVPVYINHTPLTGLDAYISFDKTFVGDYHGQYGFWSRNGDVYTNSQFSPNIWYIWPNKYGNGDWISMYLYNGYIETLTSTQLVFRDSDYTPTVLWRYYLHKIN